jgi:hypothetical protein
MAVAALGAAAIAGRFVFASNEHSRAHLEPVLVETDD